VTREVVARLAAMIGGEQADLRASLVGSQMVGLAMMRLVIRLEPVASADRADLARILGPSIQRHLSGPNDDAPAASPETGT